MNAEQRRQRIVERLGGATAPISATKLAKEFSVSRQSIVQDVAILRASGVAIAAMPRGYVLQKAACFSRVFKVYHTDEDVARELNLIVDEGGVVDDVFIFHKVYGTVRASMGLRNRADVQHFLHDIATGKSSLLKNVTAGYHYHTVTAEAEAILDTVERNLRENGFLAPLMEFEPHGVKK